MIDAKLLELGVGFIAALLVIREVFSFLEKRKAGTNGHSFIMNEHVNDVRGTVSAIKDKVDDLYEWHNKTDPDGIPLWYVKRSLEESIKALGEKIYLQVEIQTEILRHMEKMEEHYREILKRAARDGNWINASEP